FDGGPLLSKSWRQRRRPPRRLLRRLRREPVKNLARRRACPRRDHRDLAILRGAPKNRPLTGLSLAQYGKLHEYLRSPWARRADGRSSGIVEPMLQYVWRPRA
ncbi:MAG: hypothetical protein Q8K85_21950, partial [Hyphomicrobium sp.]|nr:hypothetical protein [Hyphomicrobium sp.]